MKKHVNIPVFIPHLGCPNQCVFCNQRFISGVREFDPTKVDLIISEALQTVEEDAECEIAFFGGSFTGIDRDLMIGLLEIANRYIKSGRVQSVRLSTRPDYINEEILDILLQYGVQVIELGLQSFSDEVLLASKRGHDSQIAMQACRLIKEKGFTLVGQMMVGLPKSDLASEIKTAELICTSGAEYARIYPTVVFRDTELCAMTDSGEYSPLDTEEAVERSAAVYRYIHDRGVNVIRVGLCSSENLASEQTYFAGPNHPALGELVLNRIYLQILREKIGQLNLDNNSVLTTYVPKGAISKAAGQKNKNKLILIKEFNLGGLAFKEDAELSDFDIRIKMKGKEDVFKVTGTSRF